MYAIPAQGVEPSEELNKAIKKQLRDKLGKIYTPEHIMVVTGVPKTRSGKIMRRILRKVASEEFEALGDVTTLANPEIVETLINQRKTLQKE